MNLLDLRFACTARLGVLATLAVLTTQVWAQSLPPDRHGGGDGPVNAACPVTTDEPVDPRFTVEYQGRTIGFCCRKCRTRFEADPSAYATNLPVSFSQAIEHDHQHAPDEHDDAHQHADEPPAAAADDGTHEEHHELAHAHDLSGRSNLAVWIGKFHPPATHVPIGLLIGAAIAEIDMIVTGKPSFRHAAGFCLTLGALGAFGAATLGWFNGGLSFWDSDWIQATHRWLGTTTAARSVVTLVFYLRASRNEPGPRSLSWYRAGLFITAALVGATGFFGGALVYGINHYAW